MLSDLQKLFTDHNLPGVFTREHDVIVLASPFSATMDAVALARTHRERVAEAIYRRFVRSARPLDADDLDRVLAGCCTPELSYRRTAAEEVLAIRAGGEALLLTCAPNAHLALTNFLERKALFTAEIIGRVTQQAALSPLH